jgi:hypothetical protein
MYLDSSVVAYKAEFAKVVHKKLTRDWVVPIMSARVCCIIGGIRVSGLACTLAAD